MCCSTCFLCGVGSKVEVFAFLHMMSTSAPVWISLFCSKTTTFEPKVAEDIKIVAFHLNSGVEETASLDTSWRSWCCISFGRMLFFSFSSLFRLKLPFLDSFWRFQNKRGVLQPAAVFFDEYHAWGLLPMMPCFVRRRKVTGWPQNYKKKVQYCCLVVLQYFKTVLLQYYHTAML